MTENSTTTDTKSNTDYADLKLQIIEWGQHLGFQQIGFSSTDLNQHEKHHQQWLAQGFHGEMDYMHKHGLKRSRPELLVPETLSVISVRMDYLPPENQFSQTLADNKKAYVSRYAVGRDYHKLMRNKLAKLAKKIEHNIDGFKHRVFVDSAPVLERGLAEQAGLGWIGKNTMLIHPKAGSWFFLGEIYTSLPLAQDEKKPVEHQCGECTACLKICPTDAIVAPYQVDARKCISYLTIEHKGVIDEKFRPLMGNRIYGCDDCNLICPWNRFAKLTDEKDFSPRNELNTATLLELFAWTETEFLQKLQGSPIRRIGHEQWLRNIAIALGNADYDEEIVQALNHKMSETTELVQEHLEWALQQQKIKKNNNSKTEKLIRSVEKIYTSTT